MDFQSAMETFAEAWVAANTKGGPLADVSVQNQALALTRNCKTPPPNSTASTTTGAASAGGGSGRESTERTVDTPSLSAAAGGRSGTPLEHTISPHSIKEEFDPAKTPSSGKSIPVHCIVEAVISLEESTWRRRPLIETDSYVIIPMATAFQGLVQAALLRLGYPADTAAAARGSVLIRNWKPLSFDQISEDPLTTVGDILGELATVATLKIQVFRGRPGLASDLKDKLLKFLLVQSHGLLLSTGCPLDELALSQICRGGPSTCGVSTPDISDEMRRKFDQWWAEQFGPQSPVPGTIARSQLGNPFCTQYASAHQQATAAVAKMDYQQHQNIHSQQPIQQRRSPASSLGGDHSVAGGGHPALQAVHGQYHQAAVQKTRMRTSFDPELELPKLQRWFNENQHPSRQQIQHYVKELNSLESRRGRKPLDINNVVYWFKNARAAQKRAESRGVNAASGPCHLASNATVNGYSPTNGVGGGYHHRLIPDATGYLDQHRLKGDLSPAMATASVHQSSSVQVGSDELSNIGSDMEDEEDLSETRASSPARPLSLTTNRKGQDSREASPCSSTPVPPPDIQQQQRECKEEPRNEPLNYHSSPDHINNNNNNTKLQLSDAEDEEDDEADLDQERGSGGSPGRPASRYCQSPEPMSDLPLVPRPCGVQGGGADGIDRLTAGFPLVPNSMFSHSIMYMSHYIPGLSHHHPGAGSSGPGPAAAAAGVGGLAALSADERRKRNRTFIDPVTEVPRLEQWFSLNTHPSQNLIVKYTEELNCMAYRQKFPRLEPKNVQFWFKNRRAKNKRLKMSIFDTHHPTHYHHTERD